MNGIQAIYFDLFNTLISVGRVPINIGRFTADILGLEHELWNDACFSHHHEICKPTNHFDILKTLAHSIDDSIPEDLIRQAAHERQQRFNHAFQVVDQNLYTELKHLKKRGYKLGLISNASTDEVVGWSESPLSELIDVAIFSCECGMKKPDLEIYEYALQQLGVSASGAVFVGDGGSNEFIGARHIGMYTVLTRQFLKPERYERVKSHQGDSINTEIADLSELFAELGLLQS